MNECGRFPSSVRANNVFNPLDAKAVSVFLSSNDLSCLRSCSVDVCERFGVRQ